MKLFTIGPVEMLPEIKKVGGEQIPYFRTDEFSNIMLESDRLIKKLMNSGENSKSIYLTASGTAAMEAALMNCILPTDKLLVINGGTFGARFSQICDIHEYDYCEIKLGGNEELTYKHLEEYENIEFNALVVNIDETSTGQLYDIELLSQFCKRKGMYLIVDAISSFLCDRYDMSKYDIDITIISSQKGLCIAPGLSIVVLSDRIVTDRILVNNVKSLYFNFKEYIADFERGQTPFTPCVGICLEMHKALAIVDSIGIDKYLNNIKTVALDFRNRIKDLPVSIPKFPLSNAITPVIFEKPIATKVFTTLKNEYQMMVNPTGGENKEYSIRVAHIGNTTVNDNEKLVLAIKEILKNIS